MYVTIVTEIVMFEYILLHISHVCCFIMNMCMWRKSGADRT